MHIKLSKTYRNYKTALLLILVLGIFLIFNSNVTKAHPGSFTLEECYLLLNKDTQNLSCKIYTSNLYVLSIASKIDENKNKEFEDREKDSFLNYYKSKLNLTINGESVAITPSSINLPEYNEYTKSPEKYDISMEFELKKKFNQDFFQQSSTVKLTNTPSILDNALISFLLDPDSIYYVDIDKYDPKNEFLYPIIPKASVDESNTNNIENTENVVAEKKNELDESGFIKSIRDFFDESSVNGFILLTISSILLGMGHALTPGHGKAFISAFVLQEKGFNLLKTVILGLSITISHVSSVIFLGITYYLISNTNLLNSIITDIDNLLKIIEMVSYLSIIFIGIALFWRRYKDYQNNKLIKQASSQKLTKKVSGQTSIRSVIFSGFTGGMAPCPEALTVLIIAIGIDKFLVGSLLVISFSVGMSFTIIVFAIIIGRSKRIQNRLFGNKLTNILPLISSFVIILIGFYLIISS